MIFIEPHPDVTCLTAYLVAPLTDDELAKVKAAFEIGACSRFNPILELKIVRAPDDYVGKSHQYMRAREDEAGRDEGFVVIDENAIKRHAVWYVDSFADEDAVENGEAESTDVVMKILVKTECLALTYINYEVGNIGIGEDLENAGVEGRVKNDFVQPEVSDCGGMDMKEQQRDQAVEVTVEPGDFEETRDKDILKRFSPQPKKLAKVKDDVARATGILPSWTWIQKPEPVEMPDGSEKTFPKGSVTLQQHYDPDFDWPEYKWPDGSL
ncbi:hypothetical protein FLAG1_11524 [Fusarium langsethiae]|uniref:Uncharacterized protein n=1 Tax=Fusarium langsethiae TaxID=179993 RepID=A0A0M9EMH7_FUSLA|nr:hypothetical protein FLAG1_11524 [Fusarium langsethiae]GKU12014.1 unnamed protein product [Fusarium langsethiae]